MLESFLSKYSEETKLASLNLEQKKRITRNFVKFTTNALYHMKKYYRMEDDIFSKLEVLNPEMFTKQKWLDLKKLHSYVTYINKPISLKFHI